MSIFQIRGCACEIDQLATGRWMVSVVTPDQRVHENQFATYEQAHTAAIGWIDANLALPPSDLPAGARRPKTA